jgi:hypothetical protein
MTKPLPGAAPGFWTGGLRLAAAPAFAVMALLTATDAPADVLCSAAHAPALGGMAPMYLLMSAVHAGPWLTLIARRSKMRLAP